LSLKNSLKNILGWTIFVQPPGYAQAKKTKFYDYDHTHRKNRPSDEIDFGAGYRHPCKAFADLNHRRDYQTLFDTRKRGFLSLRGANGINRNKSQSNPE
jgi:hypothetical protein